MPSRRKTSMITPSAVRTSLRRRHSPPANPLNLFPRLSSEPLLHSLPSPGSPAPPADALPASFLRNQTWTELFTSCSHHSRPSSPFNLEAYCGEGRKVVVSVSMEGSPGPVRTMVRLGVMVDDTIQQVVEQYRREGLDGRERIGEVGSRSFYLRKSRTSGSDVEVGEDGGGAPPAVLASYWRRG